MVSSIKCLSASPKRFSFAYDANTSGVKESPVQVNNFQKTWLAEDEFRDVVELVFYYSGVCRFQKLQIV